MFKQSLVVAIVATLSLSTYAQQNGTSQVQPGSQSQSQPTQSQPSQSQPTQLEQTNSGNAGAGAFVGVTALAIVALGVGGILLTGKLISSIVNSASLDRVANGQSNEVKELTAVYNETGIVVTEKQVSEAVINVLDENIDNTELWNGIELKNPEMFASLVYLELVH